MKEIGTNEEVFPLIIVSSKTKCLSLYIAYCEAREYTNLYY